MGVPAAAKPMDREWTPEMAREALIREMTDGRGIYSPKAGPIIIAVQDNDLEISVFNAVQRVGTHERDGGRRLQTMMYLWASKKAQLRAAKELGERCKPVSETASLKEICKAHGWPHQTFRERVDQGFEQVARIIQEKTEEIRDYERLKKTA